MTSPTLQLSGPCVVLLGTGGTIAGTATRQDDHVGYRAAQLGVAQLVAAVPALSAWRLETEQIGQLDSKDMSHAVWQPLAQAVAHQLARPEVAGVVITHGTDTLEETAYFLHRVLAPTKPVVLTAAMRPATALQADGPQNLLDAVTLAATPGACGVLAVLAGAVHSAADLRKLHTYRLDAFGSGDAGPIALIEQGRLRRFRPWPGAEADAPAALGLALINAPVAQWPRVALLLSHAGMDAELAAAQIDALRRHGVAGIVVAGTGNGTVHQALDAALQAVAAEGVLIWRASRCAFGAVVESDCAAQNVALPGAAVTFPGAGACTPVQARIELMLQLLRQRSQPDQDSSRSSPQTRTR
ncbi:MAG: asparaginase [Leptothrix sp. (in: b-proteobacteria)]